jgi:hypothetical protein
MSETERGGPPGGTEIAVHERSATRHAPALLQTRAAPWSRTNSVLPSGSTAKSNKVPRMPIVAVGVRIA